MTDLIKMTDEELAKWQSGWKEHSEYSILAKKEWERRDRFKQHELDLRLINHQVRWMKFSVIAAITAAVISSFLTYFLSSASETKYRQMIIEISKQLKK